MAAPPGSGVAGRVVPSLAWLPLRGLDQPRGEVDVGGGDFAESEQGEDPLPVEHPEACDRGPAAQPGAELAVDMADGEVERLLGYVGNRAPLGEHGAEILVSVLYRAV